MLNQLHISTDSLVEEDGNFGQDWYMNKIFQSRAIKVLNSIDGRCCKIRSMEDLMMHSKGADQKLEQTQPVRGESESFSSITYKGNSSVLAATATGNGIVRGGRHSLKAMIQTSDDEDGVLGKMTLKEMHRFLKRSVQKPLKGQSSLTPSSLLTSEIDLNSGSCAPVSDMLLTVENAMPMGGLELHLDSSTSNSADSSDDFCPQDVVTSCRTSEGVLHEANVVATEADCGGVASKKRTGPLVTTKSETTDDDEWTLEMWQSYKKQLSWGKKPKMHAVLQAQQTMDKHGFCEPSLLPAADTLAACSLTSAPDIDDHILTVSSKSSLNSVLDDGYRLESPATSFCRALPEDLRWKDSSMPHSNLITKCELDEGVGFHNDYLLTKSISNQDIESNEDSHNDSSLICEGSLVCSTVRLALEDESDSSTLIVPSPWVLRSCTESLPTSASKSVQPIASMLQQQSMKSCDLPKTDQGEKYATLIESEGKLRVEGARSIKSSQTDIDTAVVKPSDSALEISTNSTTRLCDAVNDECDELSPKYESSRSDHSRDSAGFSKELKRELGSVKQSKDNVNVVFCQVNAEKPSQLPVSLFTTERLDAEEEQGLDQLKPSKIPCKRKAISPLSREKLLQASKFGEHEQGFHDLDNHGPKKLPRAFKGYIGRGSLNQDWVDVCARTKGTIIHESSPPEKSSQKEEVLPGSPCHNREKPFILKSLLSKVSSLSPSYGNSVAAAAVAATPPQTQSSSSHVQRLSLVLNSSPSPPSQQDSKLSNAKSPVKLSPSIPAKGILRSTSPACQGACKCEECVSLRCRAERAAEFSQRQMHDIEGLAVKLLKELNSMRSVVEENLIQSFSRSQSPRSALSLDQVKIAANNALETEKMAKSWLVRMARDCNRYCKIMRMQERKLTFADESGGQLCHVKLFHSQIYPDPTLSNAAAVEDPKSSSVDGCNSRTNDEQKETRDSN